MKKNINIYKKTFKNNISDIKRILIELKQNRLPVSLYENILSQSPLLITSKWESKKKYSRTFFIQRAFQNEFSNNYLEISLSVDAMVNILDDLLDENLEKIEKEMYVLEFLRIFSIFGRSVNNEIGKLLSLYINKLITLAVAENFYREEIKKDDDLNSIIKKSADLLLCRGMDLDFFLQIGLLDKKIKSSTKNSIQKIGRCFRAINILKKDIKDIDHDNKNNIQTVVTTILSKKNINFREYVVGLVNLIDSHQKAEINNFIEKNKLEKSGVFIANNFRKMLIKEKKEILNIVTTL